MGNVVLLDDNTINKIAAGEVIERPSAVVKELVENSIDAKATSITVEIKNGGISLTKITDNGTGIKADDAELAFERHATSKIRSADDLMHVLSMGFRGEALASIASVSKVTLLTHNKDEEIGTKIVINGGNILENTNIGHPVGTSITVEDLFYNTPARYKFLKKDYTEAGYIEDNIVRLALANPNISFKYINNGKMIFQTAGNGDLRTNIYNIYGKELASNLINVDGEYEGIHVSGVIGNNKIARSNRNNQIFYVNKRYIKDRVLSSALDEAYRTIIPQGKFAFCVLNIEINPELVDTNVHPAKLEARFQDEQQMFRCIYHIAKNAVINNSNETPFKSTEAGAIQEAEKLDKYTSVNNSNANYASSSTINNSSKRIEMLKNSNSEIQSSNSYNNVNPLNNLNELNKQRTTEIINIENEEMTQNVDNYKAESETTKSVYNNLNENVETYNVKEQIDMVSSSHYENTLQDVADGMQSTAIHHKLDYKLIGVAWNTYIIIQIDNDIYLIDQHAAHERVMYETLLEKAVLNQTESQMLLIPFVITLTNKEKELVEENREYFEEVGYIIDDFGDNEVKVSAVPNLDIDIDQESMFKDVIDELQGFSRTNSKLIKERFVYTVACKAAVKAKMHLTNEEIIALLDDMMSLTSPFTCPHGRPTAIKMSKYEIERKFLRK